MDPILCLTNASQVYQIHKYKDLMLNRRKTMLQIWYNQQCLRRNLQPRYISLNSNLNSQSSKLALKAGVNTWIKNEIKTAFVKLNSINLNLCNLFFSLNSTLTYIEWLSLDQDIRDEVKSIGDSIFHNMLKKLDHLQNQKYTSSSYSNPYKHPQNKRFAHSFNNRNCNARNYAPPT